MNVGEPLGGHLEISNGGDHMSVYLTPLAIDTFAAIDASSPQEGDERARRAIADVQNQSLVTNVQLPKLKSRESVI